MLPPLPAVLVAILSVQGGAALAKGLWLAVALVIAASAGSTLSS